MPRRDKLNALNKELRESNAGRKEMAETQEQNSGLLKGILGEAEQIKESLSKNGLLEEEKRREAAAAARNTLPERSDSGSSALSGGMMEGLSSLSGLGAALLGLAGGAILMAGDIGGIFGKIGGALLGFWGIKKLLKGGTWKKLLPLLAHPATWVAAAALGLAFYYEDELASFFKVDPKASGDGYDWGSFFSGFSSTELLAGVIGGVAAWKARGIFGIVGKAALMKMGVSAVSITKMGGLLKNPRTWIVAAAVGLAFNFSDEIKAYFDSEAPATEEDGISYLEAAGWALLIPGSGKLVASMGKMLMAMGRSVMIGMFGRAVVTGAIGGGAVTAGLLSGPVGWAALAVLCVGYMFKDEIGDFVGGLWEDSDSQLAIATATRSMFGSHISNYSKKEIERFKKFTTDQQLSEQENLKKQLEDSDKAILKVRANLKLNAADIAGQDGSLDGADITAGVNRTQKAVLEKELNKELEWQNTLKGNLGVIERLLSTDDNQLTNSTNKELVVLAAESKELMDDLVKANLATAVSFSTSIERLGDKLGKTNYDNFTEKLLKGEAAVKELQMKLDKINGLLKPSLGLSIEFIPMPQASTSGKLPSLNLNDSAPTDIGGHPSAGATSIVDASTHNSSTNTQVIYTRDSYGMDRTMMDYTDQMRQYA
jgi:hypothetical protein